MMTCLNWKSTKAEFKAMGVEINLIFAVLIRVNISFVVLEAMEVFFTSKLVLISHEIYIRLVVLCSLEATYRWQSHETFRYQSE